MTMGLGADNGCECVGYQAHDPGGTEDPTLTLNTSWPSIRTDLRNAGAEVVDEVVVTDGSLTTSRSPDDLPAFCERIVQEFAAQPRQD